MRASRLLTFPRGMLALTLASGALLAPALASPALAAAGFGVKPGSLVAGTFTSEGATGPLGEGTTPDTQAGDHPYVQTTSFKLNTTVDEKTNVSVPEGGDIRDAVVNLPPGFVGDPNAVPYCSQEMLAQTLACPDDTVIGVAHLRVTLERRLSLIHI